jgi:hypothetical protein
MGQFWAVVVWMADRRECSRSKSRYSIANKRDGFTMASVFEAKKEILGKHSPDVCTKMRHLALEALALSNGHCPKEF